MKETVQVTLVVQRTKDTSGFEFSYGLGGEYANFALAKGAARKTYGVNLNLENTIEQISTDYQYSYGSETGADYEFEYQAKEAAINDGYITDRDFTLLVGSAGTKIAFTYNGQTYPNITSARRAKRFDDQNPFKNLVGKSVSVNDNIVFNFETNPSTLSITHPTTIIKNEFIGLDGGVVNPSQLGIVSISGEGTFVTDDDTLPIDSFSELKKAQKRKETLRFNSELFSTNVIIESLGVQSTASTNSLKFNFSLLETQIVDTGKSGFAYDKRKRRKRNMAIEGISSNISISTQIENKIFNDSQDSINPEITEEETNKNIDDSNMINSVSIIGNDIIFGKGIGQSRLESRLETGQDNYGIITPTKKIYNWSLYP